MRVQLCNRGKVLSEELSISVLPRKDDFVILDDVKYSVIEVEWHLETFNEHPKVVVNLASEADNQLVTGG